MKSVASLYTHITCTDQTAVRKKTGIIEGHRTGRLIASKRARMNGLKRITTGHEHGSEGVGWEGVLSVYRYAALVAADMSA